MNEENGARVRGNWMKNECVVRKEEDILSFLVSLPPPPFSFFGGFELATEKKERKKKEERVGKLMRRRRNEKKRIDKRCLAERWNERETDRRQ